MSDLANKPRKLIVYSREGCHLCEEMITSLYAMQKEIRFEFEVVNIDNDKNLIGLFSERVPVLFDAVEEKELCHYFLDQATVSAYFTQI
jgi:thiol-disulfide isomerase/thioredoxin